MHWMKNIHVHTVAEKEAPNQNPFSIMYTIIMVIHKIMYKINWYFIEQKYLTQHILTAMRVKKGEFSTQIPQYHIPRCFIYGEILNREFMTYANSSPRCNVRAFRGWCCCGKGAADKKVDIAFSKRSTHTKCPPDQITIIFICAAPNIYPAPLKNKSLPQKLPPMMPDLGRQLIVWALT